MHGTSSRNTAWGILYLRLRRLGHAASACAFFKGIMSFDHSRRLGGGSL
jgi:hypothetical protein